MLNFSRSSSKNMEGKNTLIEVIDSPPSEKPSKLSLKDLLNGNRKQKKTVDEKQKSANPDLHCAKRSIANNEFEILPLNENAISDDNTTFSENEILSIHSSPIKDGRVSLNNILNGNRKQKKIPTGETSAKIDPHNVKISIPNDFAISLTESMSSQEELQSFDNHEITRIVPSSSKIIKKDKIKTPISSILTGNMVSKKIDPREVTIKVSSEFQSRILSSFDESFNDDFSQNSMSTQDDNIENANIAAESEIIEILESPIADKKIKDISIVPEATTTTNNTRKKLSWKEIFKHKRTNITVDPRCVRLQVPKLFLKNLNDDENNNIDPIFFAKSSQEPRNILIPLTPIPKAIAVNTKRNQTASFKNKFFQEVYNRGKLAEANSKSNTEKQKIMKQEKLENDKLLIMRALTREEFHVKDNDTNNTYLKPESTTISFIKRKDFKLETKDILSYLNVKDMNKLTKLPDFRLDEDLMNNTVSYNTDNIIITEVCDLNSEDEGDISSKLKTHSLWVDSFLPKDPHELIIKDKNVKKIMGWLKDSFNLLEKNYQSKKRIAYIKDKLISNSGRKRQESSMDSFIDDSEYYDFELEFNDEDFNEDPREEQIRKNLQDVELLSTFDNQTIPYVPLLILEGNTGTGKTASVYCICKYLNAHVHEINSSQPHTKKALQRTLEELSTSKIVQVDKDVVLFDDVDVLFKGYDRAFWELFYSILSNSRKPIFLTCTDVTMLPDKLVELAQQQNCIVKLENGSSDQVLKYLKEKCLEFGIYGKSSDELIERIVEDNSCNLKKCIMELQLSLSINGKNKRNIRNRMTNNNEENSIFDYDKNRNDSLVKISKKLDMLSIADIFEKQTISLFDQRNDLFKNKLISEDEKQQQEDSCYSKMGEDYYLDTEFINLNNESIKFVKELRIDNDALAKTLPFELNIGSYIIRKVLS